MIAIQSIGLARYVQLNDTALASVLWHDLGWPEWAFVGVDQGTAVALVALATALIVVPPRYARHLIAPLWVAGVWVAVVALCQMWVGGKFASWLAPLESAPRALVPIALALLLGPKSDARSTSALWLIRIAAGAVFLGHGVKALLVAPEFIDYMILSVDKVLQIRLLEQTAAVYVTAIGLIDVVVAGLIIVKPTRSVLAYAAFWGFLTAFMRILYFGPEMGWPHTVLRAANGGAPLFLLLALPLSTRASSNTADARQGSHGHVLA